MTDKLYTRVSPQFDAATFTGVLIAGADLDDTYGFTELGYDVVDYDVAPTILEVTPLTDKFAGKSDVEAAAERVGITLWMNLEQYLAEWPNADADAFEERMYPATEDDNANQLLERPEVARELEAAGYEAYRGYIVVSNTQPEVTVFWKPGTFSVSEPVPVVGTDPERPYHVELADIVPSIKL